MRQDNRSSYMSGLVWIIIFSTIIYFIFYFAKGFTGEGFPDLVGPYDVVRVVDGDTIVVSINEQDRYVRLIGIDAPESTADETNKENTPEGQQAGDHARELLDGKRVYLEYDTQGYDVYGRKLAYVYFTDGMTMVNEKLVEDGYARIMIIEPNSKHERRLSLAEDKAKESGSGLWGAGFYK